MMPRWYGARSVRHLPGSADAPRESMRKRSAHWEIVNRGGGAKRRRRRLISERRRARAPVTLGGERVSVGVVIVRILRNVVGAMQLLEELVDQRLERGLRGARRLVTDPLGAELGRERQQSRPDATKGLLDRAVEALHLHELTPLLREFQLRQLCLGHLSPRACVVQATGLALRV